MANGEGFIWEPGMGRGLGRRGRGRQPGGFGLGPGGECMSCLRD